MPTGGTGVLFRRGQATTNEIDAAIDTLADQGSLNFSHRKDLRFLAGEARECWDGLSREERLYYIWLHQRVYATLRGEAFTQVSTLEQRIAQDVALVCGVAYIRTYGDDDLGDRMDTWGPFVGRERARLEAGEILPGLDGMQAPPA